jgi:hypothetical protein
MDRSPGFSATGGRSCARREQRDRSAKGFGALELSLGQGGATERARSDEQAIGVLFQTLGLAREVFEDLRAVLRGNS